MKYSYNWLKEYIPKLPKPEALTEALNMHAFEVDSIEKKNSDLIFDIKILNRTSDVGGHIGMAHEIAAILNLENKAVSKQLADFTEFKHLHSDRLLRELLGKIKGGVVINKKLKVTIEDTHLCPRYIAYEIESMNIGSSPAWLKKHLEPLGVNSINILVDLTNFIMLKIGQPMHVFDADKIKGKEIIVRRAKKGESMTTLDGTLCALDPSMLVIADHEGPVAIAGVKGGNRAVVTSATKNIIIESASFNNASVRKTSRALKIVTDASQRFAQGLDPNLAEYGMGLLVRWILEYAGGSPKGFIDVYPKPQYPRKIALRLEKLERVLGFNISEEELLDTLRRLAFKVKFVSTPREEIVALAKKMLGRPYQYGASAMYDAPIRFDCSSFVLYCFRQLGIEIPRMSYMQFEFGFPINDGDLRPGDLVFRSRFGKGMKKNSHKVGHVGLYIGGGKIIDASGAVGKVAMRSLDKFKSEGIYFGARRILTHNDTIHFVVEVPTMRKDIVIEEDLIEEVGRIVGYDRIVPKAIAEPFPVAARNINILWQEKVRSAMVAAGFFETDSYNFIGKTDIELFGEGKLPHGELQNSIRPEFSFIRRSFAPVMTQLVMRNFEGNDHVQFFEIGKVFLPENMKTGDPIEAEEDHVAGVLWSSAKATSISAENFYRAKGVLAVLFESAGIADMWLDDVDVHGYPFLHPFRSALIKVGDTALGYIGALHPAIAHAYGIKKGETVLFEIDFAKFIELAEEEIEYREPSKYPSIVRDISLVVSKEDRVQAVEDVIENTGGELLWETDLFDLYEGENIEADHRSMAFRLVFQSYTRTLRDEEINVIIEKIIKACESKNWEIRK